MDINNFIRKVPDKKFQNLFISILSVILLLRMVNEPARSMIDIVTIVLFAVLLTAILRPDIKSLIAQIKGVGFPGLQIPITEYIDKVDQVEEKYNSTIDQYSEESDLEIEQLTKGEKITIDYKLEDQLRKIAIYYNEISGGNKRQILLNPNKVINYLIKCDIIGKDIYQITQYYLDLPQKDIEENRNKIIKIGLRACLGE